MLHVLCDGANCCRHCIGRCIEQLHLHGPVLLHESRSCLGCSFAPYDLFDPLAVKALLILNLSVLP